MKLHLTLPGATPRAPSSTDRRDEPRWLRVVVAMWVVCGPALGAQQLIDRVLARVGTTAVTLTDVRAAMGLGLVEAATGDETAALRRVIDRQLVMNEVARFPPPEPSESMVAGEVAAMKAHAGPAFDALVTSTGLDEPRLRELARETLRIQAYITQRFGTSAQVTEDEARRYYDEHRERFTRDGALAPWEEVEATVRQEASAERLQATIEQWMGDLRTRAEVVLVGGQQ